MSSWPWCNASGRDLEGLISKKVEIQTVRKVEDDGGKSLISPGLHALSILDNMFNADIFLQHEPWGVIPDKEKIKRPTDVPPRSQLKYLQATYRLTLYPGRIRFRRTDVAETSETDEPEHAMLLLKVWC
jgi:hypothetical protein